MERSQSFNNEIQLQSNTTLHSTELLITPNRRPPHPLYRPSNDKTFHSKEGPPPTKPPPSRISSTASLRVAIRGRTDCIEEVKEIPRPSKKGWSMHHARVSWAGREELPLRKTIFCRRLSRGKCKSGKNSIRGEIWEGRDGVFVLVGIG
ncbi:hypothetical protein CEXT_726731 [Caerostris extrusa]|uniref:Uncharacterized protein n=1 Tax=Caerostris extrusa TaxID=172846 RepID=A0AAV4PFW6_CAEEX|nr:hypothetical protein CEXT_726731 [Caerostris extrusa]